MKLRFFALLVMISLSLPVTFTSCTPKFSTEAVQQTQEAWHSTDALYEKIMNSSDKSYSTYAANYLSVFASIDAIKITYATRKHTKTLTDIINDISGRLAKYEEEHKAAGSINNSMASIYKRNMDALWRDYYNAESHLNK